MINYIKKNNAENYLYFNFFLFIIKIYFYMAILLEMIGQPKLYMKFHLLML